METILAQSAVKEVIKKLAGEIAARHPQFTDVIIIGIQQGGVTVANDILAELQEIFPANSIPYGQLDITFYRDDIRKEILAPDTMNIPFAIENKTVVLIDDVLFTGRTIKAALDVLLDYGRPDKVELCVLADRKEHRQFPIQADYTGITVQTNKTDKVKLVNREIILLSA